MALVTTFATTPLTMAFYPPWYQKKIEAWKRGEIDWDTGAPMSRPPTGRAGSIAYEKIASQRSNKLLVYLRLDSMPIIMSFMAIMGSAKTQDAEPNSHPSRQAEGSEQEHQRPLRAHGIRLQELTDRDSSVMKVSENIDGTSDLVLNTFRIFGSLHDVSTSGELQVLPTFSIADVLSTKTAETSSDLLLLPWPHYKTAGEPEIAVNEITGHQRIIASTMENTRSNIAVLVSKPLHKRRDSRPELTRTLSSMSIRELHETTTPLVNRHQHVFLPYFGGADDRFALRLVFQMLENENITATIIQFTVPDGYYGEITAAASSSEVVTTKGGADKPAVLEVSGETEASAVFFESLRSSVPEEFAPRVLFETINTATPVKAALQRANEEFSRSHEKRGSLLVVGQNATKASAFLAETGGRDTAPVLGTIADVAVAQDVKANVIVLKAKF